MSVSVNPDFSMSSQSATFRRTVAARMEAYQQRVAANIRRELERRGEQPKDLAYHLGINPRTPERWLAGSSLPQPRHFKGMAEYFGVQVSDIKPDLEAEEQAIRDQLDRIEEKLDEILKRLPKPEPAVLPHEPVPPPPEEPPDEEETGESETG